MGVRPARLPDDEAAILSFLHGLQDHEAAFEPDRRRDPAWAEEHWQEALRRRDAHHGIMLIAEEDGAAVGWAFAHDEANELFVVEADRRHGFIAELFVVSEARGKGLGRALIAACEDWARGRSHNLLLIGVLAKNARALRAYEGAGYSPYNMILRKYL